LEKLRNRFDSEPDFLFETLTQKEDDVNLAEIQGAES
jgi:hypothetical protein